MAAAAELSPSLWSREILELRSWASVEGWEEELTDTELADGESRLEFLGGYAGDRDLPLPSTLPPPSFRADMSPCFSRSRVKVLALCYLHCPGLEYRRRDFPNPDGGEGYLNDDYNAKD